MRPTLLLLATVASCVSATKLGCLQHMFEELVARTSCGDNKLISKCLRSDIDLGRLGEIEQCYIAGGCSKADATVGAVWFAHEYRAKVREEDERVDLRRRADSSDTNSDPATETTEKTTDKQSKTTAKTADKTTAQATESSAAASSTAAPSSAAASTTADSTTSDSTTSDSTPASTTATTASSTTDSSTTTTSSSSTTGTGRVTTTGTLLCSTTNTVQTSVCSVSAGKTLGCLATVSLVATCAAGNLCMTNSDGENTCMKIDNTVGPAGIVIGIIFGSAIAAAAVGIIIMNSKANRASKRREAEQAAFMAGYPAKGKGKGRAADVEAYRHAPQAGSEANLPLISEPGTQGYGGQEFLDHGRRAPQLHPGLGALS